jgi:hypothetical protein
VNFAKATNRQVLWVIAHDRILVKGSDTSAIAMERRQDRFLELHDRDTAGIMGMLPLVLDMPMRFTYTENRTEGVFQHSRGILCGWILTDREKERIQQLDEPEIV